ncbi:MAG: hypothetical protein SWH61_03525 [Thermodesulfobacteriota bacterium]|nr:hypothetical protein [Thermodesulfobacteriota bacterium]
MMADKNNVPGFEDSSPFDPVRAATGGQNKKNSSVEESKNSSPKDKKKAGFYLSADLLERFDRAFYALKLEGVGVGNKSTLVEKALLFALDDLEKKEKSKVRRMLAGESE